MTKKILLFLTAIVLLFSFTACDGTITFKDGNGASIKIGITDSDKEEKTEETKKELQKNIIETPIEITEGVIFENDFIQVTFDGFTPSTDEEHLIDLKISYINKQEKYKALMIDNITINDIKIGNGGGGINKEKTGSYTVSCSKPQNEEKTKYLVNSISEITKVTFEITATDKVENIQYTRTFVYSPNK